MVRHPHPSDIYKARIDQAYAVTDLLLSQYAEQPRGSQEHPIGAQVALNAIFAVWELLAQASAAIDAEAR